MTWAKQRQILTCLNFPEPSVVAEKSDRKKLHIIKKCVHALKKRTTGKSDVASFHLMWSSSPFPCHMLAPIPCTHNTRSHTTKRQPATPFFDHQYQHKIFTVSKITIRHFLKLRPGCGNLRPGCGNLRPSCGHPFWKNCCKARPEGWNQTFVVSFAHTTSRRSCRISTRSIGPPKAHKG